MRYLITGGCGFLGSNLAAAVLERGEQLCVFDNLSRRGSTLNLDWLRGQGVFEFRHGDIRNPNDVQRVVEEVRPDVVFHLAGQVAMTTSLADPRLDFEINALGSFNLLDAVRRSAPEALVLYSSTNKVYGDLEWTPYEETETRYVAPAFPNGFDETAPLDFHSPYGTSKGSADQMMLDHHRVFGLRTVVFRHSSMYGGRQFATADQGWVGWFCGLAVQAGRGLLDKPFTISGTGKQVRDVLHAEDMKTLYFSAVERGDAVAGQAFNIGGGMANSLSLLELFRLLEELHGVEMRFERLPPRISDQRIFVADIAKAQRLLGWEPRVDARRGVSDMLAWIAGQG